MLPKTIYFPSDALNFAHEKYTSLVVGREDYREKYSLVKKENVVSAKIIL